MYIKASTTLEGLIRVVPDRYIYIHVYTVYMHIMIIRRKRDTCQTKQTNPNTSAYPKYAFQLQM